MFHELFLWLRVLAPGFIPEHREGAFELLLKTDINTAHKEVFDVLGILEPTRDGIIMRGSVEDLDWLARQVSIFSFDFVVREPKELKAELEKHSAKLANLSKAYE